MELLARSGWIQGLRCQTVDRKHGPTDNELDSEVFFGIQKEKNKPETFKETFGIRLRAGDKDLSANLSMVAVLKEAFFNNLPVKIEGEKIKNTKTRYILKHLAVARNYKDLPKYI